MKTMKQFFRLTLTCILSGIFFLSVSAQEPTKFYKAFEMSAGEALNLQATAKLGTKPVYGILSIGNQFLSSDHKWAFGAGVGTHLLKTESTSLNLEYAIFHVNQNEIWTDNYNNFQQIRFLASKRLGEKVSVFGGPSLNLNIAENRESFGHTFESTFAPYDIYSKVGDNHTAKAWIGFTLGIRFDK